MNNIAIFGGSFDPIHNGHIKTIYWLKETLKLNKVIIVPNKTPYYKTHANVADLDRLKMCQIAFNYQECNTSKNLNCDNYSYSNIIVSDYEISQKNYSYSVDTVRHFYNEFLINKNSCSLNFIIGMDSFLSFHKWYQFKDILKYTNLIVMNRPQYTLKLEDLDNSLIELLRKSLNVDDDKLVEEYLHNIKNNHHCYVTQKTGKIIFVNNPTFDISSTQIRNCFKCEDYDNKKVIDNIPREIVSYIQSNKLYK
jgi:nicotinate-nucleotide adenylyltransferase